MRVLVTGSTGLIGNALTHKLVAEGHAVRALVRNADRARKLLPAGVELSVGDIEETSSITPAMREIDWVFHTAGIPEQWQRDDGVFERVNARGAANVFSTAHAAGVKRVVHTSTMDVFAAPPGGTLVETNVDPDPKPTAYERSKQAAEREVEAARARGLDVVYVNPAGVYGPSPVHVGVNSLFIQFLNGKMPLVPPGGMSLAYVDGVASAHLAAAERGVNGERYLVADTHASNHELVQAVALAAGVSKVPGVAPVGLMKVLAGVSAPLARVFGFTPIIAPGQLTFVLWNARVNAAKAERELGFVRTSLEEGVRRTLVCLRDQGLVPKGPASPPTS